MNQPTSLLWTEKYRPTSLDEMAMAPEQRRLIEVFLEKGEIPHLLFSGPPGCGKTTIAKMLIAKMDCSVLMLNASKERGIEVVREKIGTFAKVYGIGRWKFVFLDEADGLTPPAQDSLRNLMEDFHEQTRFILTANFKNKIIDAIQSRCTPLEFGETPLRERILILKNILEKEECKAEMPVILQYAERYRDLRKMINSAQKSVLANAGVLKPTAEVVYLGEDLLKLVIGQDWSGIVKCSIDSSFDHRRALTDMFWAVTDFKGIAKPSLWRKLLAKSVHETQWTPDQVVHFLGTCAELMEVHEG